MVELGSYSNISQVMFLVAKQEKVSIFLVLFHLKSLQSEDERI